MPPIRPYAVAPDRLPAYVEALAAMLEGDGPALLPYADGDPVGPLPMTLSTVPAALSLLMPPVHAAPAPEGVR